MKTFRKLTIIFLLLFVVQAQAFAQKHNIYSRTLSNGLEVIVINNPVVPLVTIEIDVKNGAYT